MNRDDLLGNAASLGGSVTTCTAQAAYTSESAMLMVLSFIGVVATLSGLFYTVWNGNRNYRLQQREFELRYQENIRHGQVPGVFGDERAKA